MEPNKREIMIKKLRIAQAESLDYHLKNWNDDFSNIYVVGSVLYQTTDSESDVDYICVFKDGIYYKSEDINCHYFSKSEFINKIKNHDIMVLECLFAPPNCIYKEEIVFHFELNKPKLRESISTITSNSYVKGKKKLTVLGDYDKRLAIKSIFHSMRIVDYGIQLVTENKIYDYQRSNHILIDLKKLSEHLEHEELWEVINTKYKKIFNNLSSQFKALCPKLTVDEDSFKTKLMSLFEENDAYDQNIIDKKIIHKIVKLFSECR